MAAFMKGYESQTYALLRIVTGFVFLWHGSQKLLGFPGTSPGEAPACRHHPVLAPARPAAA